MNKKIKRIIAITLAVSAFSAIAPAKYFNLTNNAVYASTYGISSLTVNDGSSSDALKLYSSSSRNKSDETSFTESKSTYYVETSSNGVNVTFNEDIGSGCYAKVKRGSAGSYDSGARIHIANGDTMTLNVYVYDRITDKQVSSYSINVKQTSSKSSSSSYHTYYDDADYDSDDAYLDDIKLSDGDISFSKTKSTYTVNVGSSVDEIKIRAIPEDEDDTVKVNGNSVYEDEDYKETVALNQGKNEITIRVKNDENRLQTYTLYVYRGVSSSSSSAVNEDDNYQDDIYLDDLIIDNNAGIVNNNFRPKVTAYNMNVSSSCDSIIIKATPEDEDNVIRIDGEKVNSKNARRVNLKEGKNVIGVKVDNTNDYETDEDDYKSRIYTINVYRGTSSSTSTTNTQNNTTNATNTIVNNSSTKTNQLVSVNGRWQYNEYSGQPLKNQWHYDNQYGKWYFLDSEGYAKTGWAQMGPVWYYFNSDSSMVTGWIQYNGKYYYLDTNGVMQSNTKVGLYELGSDGAWIG